MLKIRELLHQLCKLKDQKDLQIKLELMGGGNQRRGRPLDSPINERGCGAGMLKQSDYVKDGKLNHLRLKSKGWL